MSVTVLLGGVAVLATLVTLAFAVWRRSRMRKRGNRPTVERSG